MKVLQTACIACSICLSSLAGPTNNIDEEVTINVQELWPERVIGRLGKPLGTRIIAKGSYGAKGQIHQPNPFTVTEIDGKPTTNDVVIFVQGPKKLLKGTTYLLEGYESGEFALPPEWLAPGLQVNFQFWSYFIVTTVLEPKKFVMTNESYGVWGEYRLKNERPVGGSGPPTPPP